MLEQGTLSESEDGEVKSDFEDLTEELSNLPHVLQLVNKMRELIKKQHKKINKLRNKLILLRKQTATKDKTVVEYGTQTDPLEYDKSCSSQDWDISNNKGTNSIEEQVKQVAESALLQSGFVYEKTSGLYYDYNTGYYYNPEQGLYYDGNSGTYYYYDEASKSYQFHSQVQTTPNETTTHSENSEKRNKQKSKHKDKDDPKKRKLDQRDKNSESNEPEEGECSDSDSNSSSCNATPELRASSESEHEDEQDLAKSYPPCMRIIVKETTLLNLKVGSLFVVTCTGGSLGREGDHSVLIPDINISKQHARFLYDESIKSYQIVDLGSRNGTFLNGKRLSVAKQESDPYEITHGSVIQVGCTKLLCHVHDGKQTCGHCEPGLIQQSMNIEENKPLKKNLHKQELKRLKSKFGVEKDNIAAASQVASGYQDRAQARRQCVGSLNHHAKTQQSSVDVSIAKDNRGFQLLSKMGWSEGRSLGKEGDGRIEPVPLMSNHNKTGLGASEADFPNIELDSNTEKKQALWRKTQQRYKEISE